MRTSSRTSFRAFAVLALLPLCIGQALATETNPCPERDASCLDTIQVTATKRPESTLHVPAATTIVGGERLRETAPQTPMDALHGEGGIREQGHHPEQRGQIAQEFVRPQLPGEQAVPRPQEPALAGERGQASQEGSQRNQSSQDQQDRGQASQGQQRSSSQGGGNQGGER